jgi:hypothetical protein
MVGIQGSTGVFLMSLDKRHQDKSGQIERKKNNTRVDTLREEYGERLAPKFRGDMLLGTLKERIGLPEDASLNQVLKHYEIKKR